MVSKAQFVTLVEKWNELRLLALTENLEDDVSELDVMPDEMRRLAHASVISHFRDLLNDEDPYIRNLAQNNVARFDRVIGVELLLAHLSAPDSRYAICTLLCDYGDERAVTPLLELLANDQDSDIRYMSAVALGYIGDTRAIPGLEHAIAHDKGVDYEGDPVSRAASLAIQKIREHNSGKTNILK